MGGDDSFMFKFGDTYFSFNDMVIFAPLAAHLLVAWLDPIVFKCDDASFPQDGRCVHIITKM